ncbi:uncharacterized protein METZ01_LOCUS474066, partial [marine metagenome]
MKLYFLLLFGGLPLLVTAEDDIHFNRDVRPILSNNCFACHGQDAKKRKAKLRLDQRKDALVDRDGSRAIIPGNLKESEFWQRINSNDPDEVMPPVKTKKILSAAEKNTLKRWIQQGAKYEAHWSFIPPRKSKIPQISGVSNPINAFLQSRLSKEGLQPAEVAKSGTLVRRLFLDLIGLPPTPTEVDAFLSDKSPKAWEKLIDKL